MIIKGTLQGQNIVMMNVYFPPAHPTTFLTKMLLDLASFLSNSTVSVGGDFNLRLNPLIDKFPHSIAPPSPQANTLHALCEEFGLTDAWRCTHPSDKQYTFFLALQKCQTRTDRNRNQYNYLRSRWSNYGP